MLNVSYENRIGYYTLVEQHPDGERKFKIWLCHANCLCAMMYFSDENDTHTAMLHMFLADMQHFRNILKSFPKMLDGVNDFHFNAKELNNDLWALVRKLAGLGKKITIE